MESRRLLLFDIDGTVLSCRGRGIGAMHRAIQRLFRRAPAGAAPVLPQGKTDPVLFEEVGAVYGLAPELLREDTATLHGLYLEALAEGLREPGACETKPGVVQLLAALAARRDTVLGLVSGNLERAAQLKLAAVGLDPYFVGGAFGSDGRRRADLVGLALERFAAREGRSFLPERVWVIGDTPDDIAGGRAHGTRTLAVATGGFAREELERCAPDVVLDSFAETDRVVDVLCGSS
jgi:phosphoglycolate phosphatase-like HAD superfamily hydrolase